MDSSDNIPISDPIHILPVGGRGPLNLLNRESLSDLTARLSACEADPLVRVLLLSGAGERAFSAGVDLVEMKEFTVPEAELFIRLLHALANRFLSSHISTIASLHGPCLGGGLELALACDVRIASENATFGMPEVRVGVPSVIEASLLPKTIGLGRARHMILTGEVISAPRAYEIGLVDKLVPDSQLHDYVMRFAGTLADIDRDVISLQKNVIVKWLEMDEEQSMEESIKAFASRFATLGPKQAMEAFLERSSQQSSDQ